MRHFIRKIGQACTVSLLTALAIAIALVSTFALTLVFDQLDLELNQYSVLLIAILVTLIIAPMLSWYVVGLFLKVDRLEAEMRQLATYDSLTGILTKREFLEQANYFHKVALRENLPYALIIADIDNFKEINDQFGHLTGDQTLESFGNAIRANLRESDLACRYGGDEFLFFLPNSGQDQAQQFANRLQKIIQKAIECSWLEIDLSVSLGIACHPDIPAQNVEEMILAADNAMYQAKMAGGKNTRHYKLERTP